MTQFSSSGMRSVFLNSLAKNCLCEHASLPLRKYSFCSPIPHIGDCNRSPRPHWCKIIAGLVWRGSKTIGGARKALDRLEWRPLRGVGKPRLHEARLQAHYAVQWLARAARAYVPPQPGDGHTSLQWEDGLDGLVTHPLSDGMRVSLQIATLTLALDCGDERARVQSFPLIGALGHADIRMAPRTTRCAWL